MTNKLGHFKARLLQTFDLVSACLSESQQDNLFEADVILISHDGDKSFIVDGLPYSPLIDTVGRYLEQSGVKICNLSRPWSKLNSEKTWSRSISVNRELATAWIFDQFFFGLFGNQRVNAWMKILQKVKPRYVIAIQPEPALCFAGKISNVVICDIQHGTIDDSYYYRKRTKKQYDRNGYPSACLCWDALSKQAATELWPNVKSVVIGHPWIASFFPSQSSDEINLEQFETNHITSSPSVLITLQWDYSNPARIQCPSLIIESLKVAYSKNWNIYIRFHPLQIKRIGHDNLKAAWERKTKLKFSSGRVYDVSKSALPPLLHTATVHFSDYSASIIEAAVLETPSIIWSENPNMKAIFKGYLSNGIVKHAPKNPADFYSLMCEIYEEKSKNKLARHGHLNHLDNSLNDSDRYFFDLSILFSLGIGENSNF